MKKKLVMLLTSVMVFALAACGSEKAPEATSETPSSVVVESTSEVVESSSEEVKEESSVIEESSEEEELDPEFSVDIEDDDDWDDDYDLDDDDYEWDNEDDMMTSLMMAGKLNKNNLTDEQVAAIEAEAAEAGYTSEWDADGYLKVTTETGEVMLFRDKWPTDGMAGKLPEMKKGTVLNSTLGADALVIMVKAERDDVKAYAQEVKAAGFNNEPQELDLGDEGYMFLATDADGYYAMILYTEELCTIGVQVLDVE